MLSRAEHFVAAVGRGRIHEFYSIVNAKLRKKLKNYNKLCIVIIFRDKSMHNKKKATAHHPHSKARSSSGCFVIDIVEVQNYSIRRTASLRASLP